MASRNARVSPSDTSTPRPGYTTQNSNIRPRNRRLISTNEQELTETSSLGNGGSPSVSESNTRSSSPIPAKYPNRTTAREGRSNGRLGGGYVNGNSAKTTAGFGKGLFEGGWTGSWSTLQELAREVLGNGEEERDFGTNGSQRRSASAGGLLGSRKGKAAETWGPEGGLPRRKEDSIGAGTLAAREAEVRTRKMKSALESWEGVNGGLDIQGRHKRRTSLEEARDADEECDAMVYVHQVQPNDTLAGVVLKYNCNPAVFRKANRLWPNDSIQVKKVVLLPVDACSIKGRPCDPPTKPLQEDSNHEDLLTNSNGRLDPSEEDDSMAGSSSPVLQKSEEEQPWTHVRWVMLFPSTNQPTEIARLPRKTLGYFPPPRRKSVTTGSTMSSPRGSLDFPSRLSTSLSSTDRDIGSTSSTPARRSSNLAPRSQPNGNYFPPLPNSSIQPPPPRREVMSTTHQRQSSNGSAHLNFLRGPGGVGSLSGKKIGSANDGLNKWANKHIPGLAIDDLPSTSITGAETANFGFDGEETKGGLFPNNPLFGSGSSTPLQGVNASSSLGLENAASAIEGWVRRLATKSPSSVLGSPLQKSVGGSLGGEGDLIELLDGAGSDDGRGFEPLPARGGAGVSGREDLEGAAVRGRGSSGGGGAGKGKSD